MPWQPHIEPLTSSLPLKEEETLEFRLRLMDPCLVSPAAAGGFRRRAPGSGRGRAGVEPDTHTRLFTVPTPEFEGSAKQDEGSASGHISPKKIFVSFLLNANLITLKGTVH